MKLHSQIPLDNHTVLLGYHAEKGIQHAGVGDLDSLLSSPPTTLILTRPKICTHKLCTNLLIGEELIDIIYRVEVLLVQRVTAGTNLHGEKMQKLATQCMLASWTIPP